MFILQRNVVQTSKIRILGGPKVAKINTVLERLKKTVALFESYARVGPVAFRLLTATQYRHLLESQGQHLLYFFKKKKKVWAGWWRCSPLISALGRKADFCEFEDSQVYRVSSWTGSIAIGKTWLKKPKKKRKKLCVCGQRTFG